MHKQKEQRDGKEKAASIGGAVRDPVHVLRDGGALPREAESEGGRRPERLG